MVNGSNNPALSQVNLWCLTFTTTESVLDPDVVLVATSETRTSRAKIKSADGVLASALRAFRRKLWEKTPTDWGRESFIVKMRTKQGEMCWTPPETPDYVPISSAKETIIIDGDTSGITGGRTNAGRHRSAESSSSSALLHVIFHGTRVSMTPWMNCTRCCWFASLQIKIC